MGTETVTEVEPVVPRFICEEEGEEDMVVNLRASFKERQCKHLFESIIVIPPLAKKPCTEILCLEPVLVIAQMPKHSITIVGTNHVLNRRPSFTGKASCPKLGGPSTSLTYLSDDSIECITFIPSCPQTPRAPNREEIAELLKQVPSFIESEALVNKIRDLFPTTRRVLVYLDNDPHISFVARLLLWQPRIRCLRYPAYVGLYSRRDDGTDKPCSSFIHGTLAIDCLTSSLLSF